jgi:hypothetical protein
MAGQGWNVRNATELLNFLQSTELRGFGYRYYWEKIGEKRSISANALSHVWYSEIAKQKGDETPEDVKRHCKAHYGIPILIRGSKEFAEKYSRIIKANLTTEQRIEIMEWFPVTRLMNKEQMKEYLDTMQIEYGKQGIILQSKCDIDYDCREANEG